MSLSKSVQFGHLNHKLHNRNWRNLMRKGRIKSPCLSRVYLLNLLSFCERKTRFTHAIAANKRANSHNFKVKKIWIYLKLISSSFSKWKEVNLRTWINRWWEWIVLSLRLLTVFEENIVVTVLAKLVSLFFKSVDAPFFSYVVSKLKCLTLSHFF